MIGIDDWAWKRGHRYGTIVCDLERHCIVDVQPDREAATIAAWLGEHPEVDIISVNRHEIGTLDRHPRGTPVWDAASWA